MEVRRAIVCYVNDLYTSGSALAPIRASNSKDASNGGCGSRFHRNSAGCSPRGVVTIASNGLPGISITASRSFRKTSTACAAPSPLRNQNAFCGRGF